MKDKKIEIPEGASFKYHVEDGKRYIDIYGDEGNLAESINYDKSKILKVITYPPNPSVLVEDDKDLEQEAFNKHMSHALKLHTETDYNDKFWQDWKSYVEDCNKRVEQPEYKVGDWVVDKIKRLWVINTIDEIIYEVHSINGRVLELDVSQISHKATDEEVDKALINYAEPIYKKGVRFRDFNGDIRTIRISEFFISNSGILHSKTVKSEWINNTKESNPIIFSPEKGWAKIITPDHINSLGEVFYDGDDFCYIGKKTFKIFTDVFVKDWDLEKIGYFTEALTKESAEKWIEENKKENHLHWIFNRLVDVHGEKPNYDYMKELKRMADDLL